MCGSRRGARGLREDGLAVQGRPGAEVVACLTPGKRRGGAGDGRAYRHGPARSSTREDAQGLRRVDAGGDGHRGWSLSKRDSRNGDAELSHRVVGASKTAGHAAQHPAFEHGPRHVARREYSPPHLAFHHLRAPRNGSRLASSCSRNRRISRMTSALAAISPHAPRPFARCASTGTPSPLTSTFRRCLCHRSNDLRRPPQLLLDASPVPATLSSQAHLPPEIPNPPFHGPSGPSLFPTKPL